MYMHFAPGNESDNVVVVTVGIDPQFAVDAKKLSQRFKGIELLFEKIPETDQYYQGMQDVMEGLKMDIVTFAKGGINQDGILQTFQIEAMKRVGMNRDERRSRGQSGKIRTISFKEINKRLDLILGQIEAAKVRYEQQKSRGEDREKVKQSVFRIVTQPKSPTPHGKVAAIVQEMNGFSSIDKNARRTYRNDLNTLLQDAESLGISDDELVQSVQSAFALLATKSVGSSRSHTSHSKNTEEKRQPALTSVSQSKEIPAYNELAAAYLNSLMTSVGSVTATKTGSKSLGDGPFRRGALSPMIRHCIYLLKRGDIDAQSFSWSEVVGKGFDLMDNGGRILVQHAKKSDAVNTLEGNLEVLSNIIRLSANDLKITCDDLNAGLARFIETNPSPV